MGCLSNREKTEVICKLDSWITLLIFRFEVTLLFLEKYSGWLLFASTGIWNEIGSIKN